MVVKRSRMTTDSFIEKAKESHDSKYDYTKTVFVSSVEKLEIICKEHGSFWQLPHSHLAGHGCAACRKLSLNDFLIKAKEIHSDRYDYSQVVITGVFNKVKIGCREHGVFEQSPAGHLRLKQGCPYCYFDRIPARHSHHKDLFVEKARKIHGDLYDYSKTEYVRSALKVDIICKEHGIFSVSPNNHLMGKKCGKCVPGGFQPSFPGYVYILKSDSKVKVGITNKDPLIRASDINATSKTDTFELVHYVLYEDGFKAQIVEKQMLSHFRNVAKTDSTEKFNGYTECFMDLDVQEVLDKLEEIA